MGYFKSFWAGSGLSALMLVMGGCDTGERAQDPAGPNPTIGATDLTGSSEFDRELIAAKTGNEDPARREQAIRAVLDKYGVAYPHADEPAQPLPAEATDGAEPVGRAAAKTAFISSAWNPLRRDFTATNDIHTFWNSVRVENGESYVAAAIGNTASVDPFLVAYYYEDENSSPLVKVVAYNDDISGDNRNSRISWTNNTGTVQHIATVAFAYSSATRGQAHLVVNTTRFTQSILNAEIGGLHQYGATALPAGPTNCFPSATWTWLQGLSGTPKIGKALVVDTKAMRGGVLQVSHVGGETLVNLPWSVDDPYPSFALFFIPVLGVLPANWRDTESPTAWRFIQKDHYSCVN
jgi:hypothetical protein